MSSVCSIGARGGKDRDDRFYLKEIIERLSHLFGNATPLRDQAAFVNHITAIAKESDVVIAQLENNRKEPLKGNLSRAVQQGVVRALTSHQKLATQALKANRQSMAVLTDLVYELIRQKHSIGLGDLDADVL